MGASDTMIVSTCRGGEVEKGTFGVALCAFPAGPAKEDIATRDSHKRFQLIFCIYFKAGRWSPD